MTELAMFKADFFRALAHPLRIRILELLSGGDRTVHQLQHLLAVEQPVVSQQLSVLRSKRIVVAQKLGTTVHYTLSDPLVAKLLGVAREIFNNHLVDTQTLLKELQRERRR